MSFKRSEESSDGRSNTVMVVGLEERSLEERRLADGEVTEFCSESFSVRWSGGKSGDRHGETGSVQVKGRETRDIPEEVIVDWRNRVSSAARVTGSRTHGLKVSEEGFESFDVGRRNSMEEVEEMLEGEVENSGVEPEVSSAVSDMEEDVREAGGEECIKRFDAVEERDDVAVTLVLLDGLKRKSGRSAGGRDVVKEILELCKGSRSHNFLIERRAVGGGAWPTIVVRQSFAVSRGGGLDGGSGNGNVVRIVRIKDIILEVGEVRETFDGGGDVFEETSRQYKRRRGDPGGRNPQGFTFKRVESSEVVERVESLR